MRLPRTPPNVDNILRSVDDFQRLPFILESASDLRCRRQYLHWDKLIRYTPPHGLSHEEWWAGIKLARQPQMKEIPLITPDGEPFQFGLPDPISERLHEIDLGAGGFIRMPEQVLNPQTKDQYYVRSLMEEAITSSQLEGATTTRQVAAEMLKTNRRPRDRSERMILNNFLTMKRIGALKDHRLSRELVFEIYHLVTDSTLTDPTAAGRFRQSHEHIVVGDEADRVFHVPPHASELESRMATMCDFANGAIPDYFIHPAIRSVILHFWLGYDHPFVDGNGRTARALFYWSMLRSRFWLSEFISISNILLKAPSKYARSFLYTETDGNDLTYFILYQLEVIQRAKADLHDYIRRKTEQLGETDAILRDLPINHRQKELLAHALRHPHQVYTIESHRMSHNVVHQTARTDLWHLHELGILEARKVGKVWQFTRAANLEEKLTSARPGA